MSLDGHPRRCDCTHIYRADAATRGCPRCGRPVTASGLATERAYREARANSAPTPTGNTMPPDLIDPTTSVQQLPDRAQLGPALACLQWARTAAWLLELHTGAQGPRIAIDRASPALDLHASPRAIMGQLEYLDDLRREWHAADVTESARVVALDAVRRALHACLDCLDGSTHERAEGVRETLGLTLRAWTLYSGPQSPVMLGAIQSAAAVLAPIVELGAIPRPERDAFNGGPLL